uniref:peptidylprolyl isomerase n=1 Tax=Natronolimnohabitans innermongolicus TaxID=253107 RepID=UPI00373AE923
MRHRYFVAASTSGITLRPSRRAVLASASSLGLSLALAGCASVGDDASDSSAADASDRPDATLHTSRGDIEVELHDERAPRTVDNFVGLATGNRTWIDPETGEEVEGEPLYDDLLFHRVIAEFMIQTDSAYLRLQAQVKR